MMWTMATYFVVPVLVMENKSVSDSFKRSATSTYIAYKIAPMHNATHSELSEPRV